jgi:hypothetical protein
MLLFLMVLWWSLVLVFMVLFLWRHLANNPAIGVHYFLQKARNFMDSHWRRTGWRRRMPLLG